MKLISPLVTALTLASALLTGCGGESGDSPNSPDRNEAKRQNENAAPADFVLSCVASTSPAEIGYAVEGDILRLIPLASVAKSLALRRVGSGSGAAGTWEMPAPPLSGDAEFIRRNGLTIRSVLAIEDGRITVTAHCSSNWATLQARVSSPIVLSDATIRVLESHEDARRWTPDGGAEVVRSLSRPLFGAKPESEGFIAEAAFPPAF